MTKFEFYSPIQLRIDICLVLCQQNNQYSSFIYLNKAHSSTFLWTNLVTRMILEIQRMIQKLRQAIPTVFDYSENARFIPTLTLQLFSPRCKMQNAKNWLWHEMKSTDNVHYFEIQSFNQKFNRFNLFKRSLLLE